MNASEERLVAILDGIGECFYAVDRDWRLTVFNRGSEDFFGFPRSEVLGRLLWEVIPVLSIAGVEPLLRAAMEGRAGEITARSAIRPDRWLEGRFYPIPDGVGISFRDVTERRADETALRQREAELAHVQRIVGIGSLQVELTAGFRNRRSPEYLKLHGLPPEAADEPHEDWVARIHPEDREKVDGDFRRAVEGHAVQYEAEYRIVRPSDGETRWIAASAEIERGLDGRAVRLIGAHRDVTDRKRAELHQKLLINELNHRVKNTLATVQSIAVQSLRREATTEEARHAFESRLLALSRAHDVLTRESWDGAELREIVDQALDPYRAGVGERFTVEGQSLRLSPRSALALAMALQELATNALKYGALSISSGRVSIAWGLDVAASPDRPLHLSWVESGGPPVTPPTRLGFGRKLIERNLAQDLEGDVVMDFAPGGLVCRLQARLPSRS
ncbi:sensor histidine kinase [uncultured Enterovirga sp.]|uniref:sensor histidine kinase n=1 Tax=uncultured Enterovirga sp. TaxID=2026352 RepID=UPI0035CA6A0D